MLFASNSAIYTPTALYITPTRRRQQDRLAIAKDQLPCRLPKPYYHVIQHGIIIQYNGLALVQHYHFPSLLITIIITIIFIMMLRQERLEGANLFWDEEEEGKGLIKGLSSR